MRKKIDNDNLDDVFMWQGFSGILKRKRECEDRERTREGKVHAYIEFAGNCIEKNILVLLVVSNANATIVL